MSDIGRSMRAAAQSDESAAAAITLAEVVLARAWNVCGDAARASFAADAERLLGLPLPLRPNTSVRGDATALLWLGPRSWLLVGDHPPAQGDFDATRKALNAAGGALFDVSASHVAWTISGEAAARVLNRGCPLDLHAGAFPAGRCAQSVLGHVTALVYKPHERPAFIVLVARSFAADAFEFLRAAAESDSSRISAALPLDAVLR